MVQEQVFILYQEGNKSLIKLDVEWDLLIKLLSQIIVILQEVLEEVDMEDNVETKVIDNLPILKFIMLIDIKLTYSFIYM